MYMLVWCLSLLSTHHLSIVWYSERGRSNFTLGCFTHSPCHSMDMLQGLLHVRNTSQTVVAGDKLARNGDVGALREGIDEEAITG